MSLKFKVLSFSFGVLLFSMVAPTHAVKGFAVNVMGGSMVLNGINYGTLWRHDIERGVAVRHRKLYNNQCANPVISSDGKWIAFHDKATSKICIMSSDSGAVTQLAQGGTSGACIDFPDTNWIYFTMGFDGAGSRTVKRVNKQGSVETIGTFPWSAIGWCISHDLSRVMIRAGDNGGTLTGRILAYEMATGNLTTYRDVGEGQSCSAAMSCDGRYVLDGWVSHGGHDIRKWDGTIVWSLKNYDAEAYAPNYWKYTFPIDDIHQGFSANMSSNSARWYSVTFFHTGKMQMVNWVDSECIFPTGDMATPTYGCAGDFWAADTNPLPKIKCSSDSIAFFAPLGGSNPVTQTVAISNPGVGTLKPLITSIRYLSGNNWLTVTRSGSGNSQVLSNQVSLSGLAGLRYNAEVTVKDSNLNVTQKRYLVSFKVVTSTALTAVSVTPATDSIAAGNSRQFSMNALDQYGEVIQNPSVVWKLSSTAFGSIDSLSGLFRAGATSGTGGTVTAKVTFLGVTQNGTATVGIKPNTLYLTRFLALQNNGSYNIPVPTGLQGEPYMINSRGIPRLDIAEKLLRPKPGDTISVYGTRYTWQIMDDGDGLWGDIPLTNQGDDISYFGVYVLAATAMDVKIAYRIHSTLKIFVNGVQSAFFDCDACAPAIHQEQTSGTVHLNAGSNFVLMKHAGGPAYCALRIIDNTTGNPITSLNYTYGSDPVSVLPLAYTGYKPGDKVRLSWIIDPTKITGSEVVSFSRDGRIWYPITGAVAQADTNYYKGATGTVVWTIPDSIADVSGPKVSTLGTACLLRVQALYDVNSPFSITPAFTIRSASAGVRDLQKTAKINTTPVIRMVNRKVLIHSLTDGEYTVTMHDLAGRVVYRGQGSGGRDMIVSCQNLASGVKTVMVQSGSRVVLQKIVVQ